MNNGKKILISTGISYLAGSIMFFILYFGYNAKSISKSSETPIYIWISIKNSLNWFYILLRGLFSKSIVNWADFNRFSIPAFIIFIIIFFICYYFLNKKKLDKHWSEK